MDLTNKQIEQEFRRQTRLCQGIGPNKMLTIICEQFGIEEEHASTPSPNPTKQQLRNRAKRLFYFTLLCIALGLWLGWRCILKHSGLGTEHRDKLIKSLAEDAWKVDNYTIEQQDGEIKLWIANGSMFLDFYGEMPEMFSIGDKWVVWPHVRRRIAREATKKLRGRL